MTVQVSVPAESSKNVVYKGLLRGEGDGPTVSAIIVAGIPANDNERKGSYTFGPESDSRFTFSSDAIAPGSSARGSLADVDGFSTDALMLQKASEKRREHRWSK